MPQAIAAVVTAAQAVYATAVSAIATPLVALAGEGAAIAIATNVVNAGLSLAVSTGINAVARAGIPDAEFAATNRKQAIPDRLSGYGRARLGGAFMLWEAQGPLALNVLALHDGRCDGIEAIYLNDETVTVLGTGFVQSGPDLRYGKFSDLVRIDTRLGLDTETRYSQITDTSIWPSTARGDGIASLMMIAKSQNQEQFLRDYPNGLPLPSAVVRMQICYDPRLGDRDDPGAWAWTRNPVLQLLDYMTNPDQGMGLDYTRYFASTIPAWITAANVCDEAVPLAAGGTVPRYTGDGTYLHSTAPADVMATILACFDGWIAQDAGGAFVIEAGKYYDPTVTITDAHIVSMDRQFYIEDERAVNELIISYTSPAFDYTEVEAVPWRDENDILDRDGQVRSQRLSLPWVSTNSQARRLAKITMARATSPIRGTITTTLYGLKAMGKRRIRIQAPNDSAVMANIVVDVVSVTLNPDFTVTIPFIATQASAYNWDAATEENTQPPVVRPPDTSIDTPVLLSAVWQASFNRLEITVQGPVAEFYEYRLSWTAQDLDPPEQIEFPIAVASGGNYVIYTTSTVPSGEIIDVKVAFVTSSGATGDYSNTLSISTGAGNAGSLNVTEASDTASASGTVTAPDITATATITENGDTLTADATIELGVVGNASIVEDGDTLTADGEKSAANTGDATMTEASDTVSASGTVAAANEGNATITEAGDTLAAGGSVGKTYADFQAHIATLATGGTIGWNVTPPYASSARRVTVAAASGQLQGTPWGEWFGTETSFNAVARVVQHALPSEAAFNAQVSAGREVFIRFADPELRTYLSALTRNGYTSNEIADDPLNEIAAVRCTELIYWDGTQAQRMVPSSQSGPSPYSF